METESYKYTLIGGARDGEEGEQELEDGGIIDNLTFVHPAIDTLCLHYRLESLYADENGDLDAIDYIFVREFNKVDFEEYAEHHLTLIGEEND